MRAGTIISIIIIIALIIVGAPWISGYLFKRNFFKMVNTINNDPEFRMNINVPNYDMGWLQSQTTIDLNIQKFPKPIIINQVITHGPIVTDILTNSKTIALGNIKSTISLAQLSNGIVNGDIVVNTLAKVGGGWIAQVTMPTLTSTIPGKGSFSVTNLKADATYWIKDNVVNADSGDFSIDSIQYQSANQKASFKLNGFSIIVDGKRDANNFWNGTEKITINDVSATNSKGELIGAQNFVFNGQASTSGLMATISSQFTLQKLILPTNNIANEVGPINHSLTIKNLDANKLIALSNNLQKNTANLNKDNIANYPNQFLNVIGPDFTVNQQFSLMSPLGIFSLNFDITIPGQAPNDIPTLIQKANINVDLTASIALVNKVIDEYARIEIEKAKSQAATQVAPAQPGTATQEAPTAATTNAATTNGTPSNAPINEAAKIPNEAQTTQSTTPTPEQPGVNPPPSTNVALPNIPTPTPEQRALAKIGMIKQFIDSGVKEGYIIVNNNNYVVNIKRVNGAITINGKAFSMPIPAMTNTGSLTTQ